jgi:hypothetical protein
LVAVSSVGSDHSVATWDSLEVLADIILSLARAVGVVWRVREAETTTL